MAVASLKEAKVDEWQEKAEERREIAEGQKSEDLRDYDWENPEGNQENPEEMQEGAKDNQEKPEEQQANDDDDFVRTPETGFIKSWHPRNVVIALNKLGITLRQNDFTACKEITGLSRHAPEHPDGELSDPIDIRLRYLMFEEFDFLADEGMYAKVLIDIAHKHRFHPVRQYLAEQEPLWDKTARIDTWIIDFGGAEDTAFNRAVARIWLIAAVRRVRQPGCKFDTMLVFESKQGTEKSGVFRTLARKPEWFSDDLPLDSDSKVVVERTAGVWIVESAELSGMGRREVDHLKAFLSRAAERCRKAWGREPERKPRQFVIAGTINPGGQGYLLDVENRRFWPVKTPLWDIAGLEAVADQLWAEAAHYETLGESIVLPRELWPVAAEIQAEREAANPLLDKLAPILGNAEHGPQGWILAETVWDILEPGHGVRMTERPRMVQHLGRAMKKLGFELKQERARHNIHGRTRGDRFWERGKDDAERAMKINAADLHDGMQSGVGNGSNDGRRDPQGSALSDLKADAEPPPGSVFSLKNADGTSKKKH